MSIVGSKKRYYFYSYLDFIKANKDKDKDRAIGFAPLFKKLEEVSNKKFGLSKNEIKMLKNDVAKALALFQLLPYSDIKKLNHLSGLNHLQSLRLNHFLYNIDWYSNQLNNENDLDKNLFIMIVFILMLADICELNKYKVFIFNETKKKKYETEADFQNININDSYLPYCEGAYKQTLLISHTTASINRRLDAIFYKTFNDKNSFEQYLKRECNEVYEKFIDQLTDTNMVSIIKDIQNLNLSKIKTYLQPKEAETKNNTTELKLKVVEETNNELESIDTSKNNVPDVVVEEIEAIDFVSKEENMKNVNKSPYLIIANVIGNDREDFININEVYILAEFCKSEKIVGVSAIAVNIMEQDYLKVGEVMNCNFEVELNVFENSEGE